MRDGVRMFSWFIICCMRRSVRFLFVSVNLIIRLEEAFCRGGIGSEGKKEGGG